MALAVLVHNQNAVGSFNTVSEAWAEGAKRFGDGEFSRITCLATAGSGLCALSFRDLHHA